MPSPTLGHVHLKVRDLATAVSFYRTWFDLTVTEQIGNQMAFLSNGERHHDIALQALGDMGALPEPYSVGLYHVAFEVPDRDQLTDLYHRLRNAGVAVVGVDHGISWALYFSDPDGNGLEVYWDTRRTENGKTIWGGTSRRLTRDDLALE